MVFDEIDAGIGGETANAVGETLAPPAERAQVVTITHLPQIASLADRHFRVEKVPGDPTHTPIEQLGETSGATSSSACSAASSSSRPSSRSDELRRVHRPRAARPADEEPRRAARPGDVAIIDHPDIDRVSAEELLDSGVRVVVNVARRRPAASRTRGRSLLVRGGVRLIDAPGAPLFDEVSDGEP